MKTFFTLVVLVLSWFGFTSHGNAEIISPSGQEVILPFDPVHVEVSQNETITVVYMYQAIWPGGDERFNHFKFKVVSGGVSVYDFYPIGPEWDLVSGEYVVVVVVDKKDGSGTVTYTSKRFWVFTSIPQIRILYPDSKVVFSPLELVGTRWEVFGLGGGFSDVQMCIKDPVGMDCLTDYTLDPSGGWPISSNTFNWVFPEGHPNGLYELRVFPAYRQDSPGATTSFWVDNTPTIPPTLIFHSEESTQNLLWIEVLSGNQEVYRSWWIETSTNLSQNVWVNATTRPFFTGTIPVFVGSQSGGFGQSRFFRAKEHKEVPSAIFPLPR